MLFSDDSLREIFIILGATSIPVTLTLLYFANKKSCQPGPHPTSRTSELDVDLIISETFEILKTYYSEGNDQ